MEGEIFHKSSCNRISYTATSCECGFIDRLISQDHSSNIFNVDDTLIQYNVLLALEEEKRARILYDAIGEYGQYHDLDDWVPLFI